MIDLPTATQRLFSRIAGQSSHSRGGLVEGTNAGTYQNATAIEFKNGSVLLTKAATDNVAFTAGHTALNPNADTAQKCKFLITLSAGGTFKTTQSAIVAAADPDPDLPAVPAAESVVGDMKVETNSSTTFTPGTTDLGAAGITDTFRDLTWADSGIDGIAAL